MRIEFIKECLDKNTKEFYKVGTVKEFEEVRANEIVAAGYAKEVLEVKEDPQQEQPLILVELATLSKAELIKAANDLGVTIKSKDTKEAIIEKINAAQGN